MRIATFNTNSIRSRVEIICDWLKQNSPDILCLQETKVCDEDFPVEAFESTGYFIEFSGQKRYNGVAIFSKYKPISVSSGFEDDAPNDKPRLITIKIDKPDITVVNTYVPQGTAMDSEKFIYKLGWFKRLKEYFDSNFSNTDNIIWTGDLNVALTEKDVHDAEKIGPCVCYCPEVQQALLGVMGWGFEDMFRKFNQEDKQFTFWDYRIPNGFKRNLGWRLDYIMATKEAALKCKSCWIDKEPRSMTRPSDHTFLAADFDI